MSGGVPVDYVPFFNKDYVLALQVYALLISLTILVFDIVENFVDEIDLLLDFPISFVRVAYFLSRWGALGFIIGSLAFEKKSNADHCKISEVIPNIFYFLCIAGSGLIFLLRLRAVYYGERLIVSFFSILWAIVTVLAFTVPFFVTSQSAMQLSPPTPSSGGIQEMETLCADDITNTSVVVAAVFAPAIYDTLIFLAISWRLAKNSYIDMKSADGLEAFLFGKYLPNFTRKMLQDGQQYYLIIIFIHTPVLSLYLDGYLVLKSILYMPNFVVPSILACRLYRETRHRLTDSEEETSWKHTKISRLIFGQRPVLSEAE